MLKTKLKIMKTIAQSPRRGVSHTPQSHTPQTHTLLSHTPQTHTPQTHTPQTHTFHHRRSIRLKGYDYSADGLYFITICTKDRNHYFGHVVDGKMVLSEKGVIVKNEWLNTINIRRGEVILHEYIVMPNHFHAIIEICRGGVSHTPQIHTPQSNTPDDGLTSNNVVCDVTNNGACDATNNGVCDVKDRGVCDTPLRSPSKTLGSIVRGFKSAVTKQIGFPVWQRNYHEHIIRNTNAFTKISNYILNNPAQWHCDMFNNG